MTRRYSRGAMRRFVIGAILVLLFALTSAPGAAAKLKLEVVDQPGTGDCTAIGYNPVTGQRLVKDCIESGYVIDDGHVCSWSHHTVYVNDVPVFFYNTYSGEGNCWSYGCIDFLVYYDTNPVRAGVGCQ